MAKKGIMNIIKGSIVIFVMAGSLFSVYFWLDDRYALANDVKEIEQRLDIKILEDQMSSIQERIWKLEDRLAVRPHGARSVDITAKEELRELKEKKETIDKKIQSLIKGKE